VLTSGSGKWSSVGLVTNVGTVERNRDIALAVNDGLSTLDEATLLSYFSADPVWHINRQRYEGRDGVRRIVGFSRQLYPHGLEHEVQSVVADEERVVVQHIIRARTNKGVNYENEYVTLFEFDPDGRISAIWEYLDSAYSSKAFDVSSLDRSTAVPASSSMLPLSVDEVLTTTRAVRKRLNLERGVERSVVEECLRLAFQAPNGSNKQEWRWVLVDDPDIRRQLAELYRQGLQDHLNRDRSGEPVDDGSHDERMSSSVQYLAQNFERVPILVVPTVARRYGGATTFQQASRWGSILPAVWSFQLALRSRGLGSAWTTLHLYREQETADLLGIPHGEHTQAGLFPVAYTLGAEFRPADRAASEQRIGWNHWAP
jgi:nitroreductase/ketosteroid isomerase-like protein